VWNVTPRSVGVEIAKRVRQRIILKRIHVRIEHVKKSRCREAFLQRVKANQSRETGVIKRQPAQPHSAVFVKTGGVEDLAAVPFEFVA